MENFLQNNARVRVIGIGDGGGVAIDRMMGENINNVNFIAINTYSQALMELSSQISVQIGNQLTHGMGAAGNPDIGRKAAEESFVNLMEVVRGAEKVFIVSGMGGGTGTGASPVVAKIAKKLGAMTIGIVTRPFTFEGERRERIAKQGIDMLTDSVDMLVVIPNDRLIQYTEKKADYQQAFAMVSKMLAWQVLARLA